jgi:hypothetical protein
MPSPFPGMDPWLERESEWPGFHDILIVKTVEVLQPQLRARGYYANPGERVWLTEPQRPVLPDVVTVKRSHSPAGAVAVMEPDEPVRVQHDEVEFSETFIDIYDAAGNQLVAGIEFVSPTNKRDRQGRELYRRKQQELREAGVHLVEIDLLRRGPHVLEVPDYVVDNFKPWEYLVNLARRGSDEYQFYPVRLRDRLPRIRVPLKTGDEDAVLDLQEVFRRSYEIGPYPERLDYAGPPPEPPLAEEDLRWLDETLKSKGIRQ